MAWHPDEGLIGKLESYWTGIVQRKEMKETKLFGIAGAVTVGNLADSLRSDGCDDIAQHLEENYKRTDYLKPSSSIAEAVADMRKGTPYGVLTYVVVGGHFDCCGPGAHEKE